MKRVIPLLLALVMLTALLGGCGYQPVETRMMNTDLTIQYETNRRGTVTTEHGDVYEFQFDNNGLSIVYPDGKTYVSSAIPTLNRPYEGDEYLGMSTLAWVIADAEPFVLSKLPLGRIVLALVIIAVGVIFLLAAPQIAEVRASRYGQGNPKPTRYNLWDVRITAALAIAAGVIVLIFSVVSAI